MKQRAQEKERKKERKGKTLRCTPPIGPGMLGRKNPALETSRIGSLISHHTLRVMVK